MISLDCHNRGPLTNQAKAFGWHKNALVNFLNRKHEPYLLVQDLWCHVEPAICNLLQNTHMIPGVEPPDDVCHGASGWFLL